MNFWRRVILPLFARPSSQQYGLQWHSLSCHYWVASLQIRTSARSYSTVMMCRQDSNSTRRNPDLMKMVQPYLVGFRRLRNPYTSVVMTGPGSTGRMGTKSSLLSRTTASISWQAPMFIQLHKTSRVKRRANSSSRRYPMRVAAARAPPGPTELRDITEPWLMAGTALGVLGAATAYIGSLSLVAWLRDPLRRYQPYRRPSQRRCRTPPSSTCLE